MMFSSFLISTMAGYVQVFFAVVVVVLFFHFGFGF